MEKKQTEVVVKLVDQSIQGNKNKVGRDAHGQFTPFKTTD